MGVLAPSPGRYPGAASAGLTVFSAPRRVAAARLAACGREGRSPSGAPCWPALGSLCILVPLTAKGCKLKLRALHRSARRSRSSGHTVEVVKAGNGPQEAATLLASGFSGAAQPMPPGLAAAAYEALCDKRQRRFGLESRWLNRELGSTTLELFRASLHSARAMAAAATAGLMAQEEYEKSVGDFLARSWASFSAVASGESQEVAALLGRVLANTREEDAREGFRRVLRNWASIPAPEGDASSALSSHVASTALTSAEKPKRKQQERSFWTRVLDALRSMKPQDAEMALRGAEALALLVLAKPEHLKEGCELLRPLLARLDPDVWSGLWDGLAEGPYSLRVAFLQAAFDKGGLQAWQQCGISASAVAADLAELTLAMEARKWLPLFKDREKEQTAFLLAQLDELCREGAELADLASEKALVLARHLRDSMGTDLRRALTCLPGELEREPSGFDDVDLLAVALMLPDDAGEQVWQSLARALLGRWAHVDAAAELLPALHRAPLQLAAAPQAWGRALLAACEEEASLLLRLPLSGLEPLLAAWAGSAGRPLPGFLQLLLKRAVEEHLLDLAPRSVVAASRILCRAPAVPRHGDVLLGFWRTWMPSVISDGRWGNLYETLRGLQEWRASGADGAATVAELVLRDVVGRDCCALGAVLPLDLLIEVGGVLPRGGAMASRMEEETAKRIEQLLQEEGGLPLTVAVAVAQGETLVPCPMDSPLWDSVTRSIAAQLSTTQAVDLLSRCVSSPDLRSALLALTTGWLHLELQMRLPTEAPDRPAVQTS